MSFVNNIVFHWCKRHMQKYDSTNKVDYKIKRQEEIEQVKNFHLPKEVKIEDKKFENFSYQYIYKYNNPQDKVIYYIHGGGFVLGCAKMKLSFTTYLANKVGYNVIAIDYPLAPEYPYPNGLLACVKMYQELLKTYDASNIIFFGESAGGNLVLSTILKVKELNLPMPKMAIVNSPCVQFDKNLDSYTNNIKTECMVNALSEEVLDTYLSGHQELMFDKLVSPIYADFKGFCPTHIFVSKSEVLYDDSILLYDKLKTQKVKSEIFIRDHLVHAWLAIPQIPEAKKDLAIIKNIIDEDFKYKLSEE